MRFIKSYDLIFGDAISQSKNSAISRRLFGSEKLRENEKEESLVPCLTKMIPTKPKDNPTRRLNSCLSA